MNHWKAVAATVALALAFALVGTYRAAGHEDSYCDYLREEAGLSEGEVQRLEECVLSADTLKAAKACVR